MTATETLHVGAERAPFVMVPRWLLHHRQISDGAKVLYGMLHDLVAGREGPTRPVTRAQLAEFCGVSVATVDRRLVELVEAGAVDKHAQFETTQGQLANVYWVRLSVPLATVETSVDNSGEGGCRFEDPPSSDLRTPPPHPCSPPVLTGAAPYQEVKQEQELPPQPPRTAGGPTGSLRPVRRRTAGTTLRAVGTNPRADTDRALAAEAAAAAAARAAELEAKTAARRAIDAAAQADTERFDAEALALSAVLDDDLLAEVFDLASRGLAGPLGRSPLAVTRAVVGWCRTAVGAFPGPVPAALAAAVAAGWQPAGDPPTAAVDLDPAPAGTADLRSRIARVLHSEAAEATAVAR